TPFSVTNLDLHNAAFNLAMDRSVQARRDLADDALVVSGAQARDELAVQGATAIKIVNDGRVLAPFGTLEADVAVEIPDLTSRDDDVSVLLKLLSVVAPHRQVLALRDLLAADVFERGHQQTAVFEDDFSESHVLAHQFTSRC